MTVLENSLKVSLKDLNRFESKANGPLPAWKRLGESRSFRQDPSPHPICIQQ
jgi:hypothetical protein